MLIKGELKMEKQNNGIITDKNFKSNKIEPISNMAIDIMNTGLPLELAGAVATDLYEQGYRKETQGEWRVRGIQWKSCPINHSIKCSNCGFDIEMLQGKRYRYCPNCGAKMRGE